MSFWDKVKENFSKLAYGEESDHDGSSLSKQQRVAKLNEIEKALVVLTAEVIKRSGSMPDNTISVFHNFFNLHFGFKSIKERDSLLTQQLRFSTGQYIKIACKQLKALADNQSLEEMLIFLFAIAASDTFIVEKERKLLYQICLYLGFNDTLFYKIMSLYKDVSSPYAILEVSETVTKEELTLAYRKKVLLYHPDSSQLHLSEAEKTRKFLAVKSAFDAIMKEKFQKL